MHYDREGPRQHTRQTIDLPAVWGEVTQVYHAADHGNHEHVHPLETLPDLGHLCKEVGVGLLFSSCTPGHVDAEHVGADGE